MFSFLKDKLKGVLEKISKKVEDTAKKEEVEEKIIKKPVQKKEKKTKAPRKESIEVQPVTPEVLKAEDVEKGVEERKEEVEPEKKEQKGFFSTLFRKKEEPEEQKIPEPSLEQPVEEKKGFLAKIKERIVTTQISNEQFDGLFEELEMALLENNVAFSVVEQIKEHLKKDLVNKPIGRGKVLDTVKLSLHKSIEQLFAIEGIDLVKRVKEKQEKPFVIVFVGVNGSGKTTSIAKVAHLLKKHGLTSIISASDTFRAGSIAQLEEHGKNLGVRVVKHDYGSDPAAVCFDTIRAAQAQKIDVVLIDTAGRQHSNKNLMEEMKKIVRVAKPDLKIFIGEALTGNDAVSQAEQFNEAIGIDGIILTKADVDEKGGAMVSVSYITKKPILYLGVGQRYDDLQPFSPDMVLKGLGL